ncbi:MAG: hypothetical protein JW860_11340 [Sedimentisphaerales bacterium]|nr:hypothetical protein [Sedimentisphaerales bacterium]
MTYAIVLLIVGAFLIIMEFLIPSGGILGFMAAAAIAGAVYLGFKSSEMLGFGLLLATFILLPIVIVVGLKILPNTPIGKEMSLKPSVEEENDRGKNGVNDENFSELVGRTGTAVSALRPSGIAEIEGQRYSVVSEGGLVDKGVKIKVVGIEGNSIIVEEIT